MSLVTTVPASSGLDWSSSTKSLNFLPRTPPAPLISSKAIVEPFFVEIPKVAIPHVSDTYSPMRISYVDRPLPQPRAGRIRAAAATQKSERKRIVMPHRVLFSRTRYSFAEPEAKSKHQFSQ